MRTKSNIQKDLSLLYLFFSEAIMCHQIDACVKLKDTPFEQLDNKGKKVLFTVFKQKIPTIQNLSQKIGDQQSLMDKRPEENRGVSLNIINKTLIKVMSLTRKCLDRKHLMSKLEQVKLDISGEIMKNSLAQTVKRQVLMSRKSKSREKTIKLGQRSSSLRQPSAKSKLDRSKQSRQSRQSLLKSTQSYYVANRKTKREPNKKLLKTYHSKQIVNCSNPINSTFEMQSFTNTHKKKASNFSSIVPPKEQQEQSHLIKSNTNHETSNFSKNFQELLLKSQTILGQYKTRNEALQKENKRYKKRYQEALKKIKSLESRY